MKKIIVFLLLVVIAAFTLRSASVTLAWDANSEPDLAGYRLYSGTNGSGIHTLLADVGNVTLVTVSNLTLGATYYFVVTAYNTSGLESTPSNEISYKVPDLTTTNKVPEQVVGVSLSIP